MPAQINQAPFSASDVIKRFFPWAAKNINKKSMRLMHSARSRFLVHIRGCIQDWSRIYFLATILSLLQKK
jgi:hypothetical protein